MDNIGRVQELQGAQCVVQDNLQMSFIHIAFWRKFNQFLKISTEALHHDEDIGQILLVLALWHNNVNDLRSEKAVEIILHLC